MSETITSLEDRASYAVGRQLGENLVKEPFEGMQPEAVLAGMADALMGRSSPVSADKLNEAIEDLNRKTQQKMHNAAQERAAEGEDFLKENAQREEVDITETGLQYEVLEEGEGEPPVLSSRVKVHYHGTLIDGTVFDSSVDRGEPIDFPVSGVIPGWTEALQMMSPGAKYKLYIPYQLAYGERGAGEAIPPYTTLIFDVELLEIL